MKILNLYAGIGGNRKLWGDKHDITAVEIDPEIAEIYRDLYPDDNVIIGDAHEYLRKHFREYNFIWASPPCQSHSGLNYCNWNIPERLRYPDMSLYQEILFLEHFFKGKWVIENVKPYYKPLISPTFTMDRHYFWSSDFILTPQIKATFTEIKDSISDMAEFYNFNLENFKINSKLKRTVLRNCVKPEVGKYILEQIINNKAKEVNNAG